MKKYVSILILLLIIGCDKDNRKIVLLENDDEIYMPINEVDSFPKLPKDSENIRVKVDEIFRKNWNGYEKIKEPAFLSYLSYIDENGSIKKMKRTLIGGKFGINIPQNYVKDIEPKILDLFESLNLEPAEKNKKRVKFRGQLSFMMLPGDSSKPGTQLYLTIGIHPAGENFNLTMNANTEYVINVDQQPEPIGGIMAIQKNIRYPEDAKKKKIQGTVFVKAFIDENGNVVKTEVIKGTNSSIDTAATNAIKITKFTPGKQSGIPVKTQVAVPIAFKLK